MAIKTVVINKGLRGNSVLNGTGVPSAVLGINGDFYIDTAALKIYGPKASGLWGSGTSLGGGGGGGITWSTPVNANIIPDVDLTRSIGSPAKNFVAVNTNTINANNLLTINAQYGINVAPGNPAIALLTSGAGAPIRLRFNTTGDAFNVSVRASDSLTQTTDYIWPLIDGTAGQLMSTDGAGNMSWVSGGGGGSLANDVFFKARNAADSADINLFKVDAGDNFSIYNPSGNKFIDVSAMSILDFVGGVSVEIDSRQLRDENGTPALKYSFADRRLFDVAGATSLNWSNAGWVEMWKDSLQFRATGNQHSVISQDNGIGGFIVDTDAIFFGSGSPSDPTGSSGIASYGSGNGQVNSGDTIIKVGTAGTGTRGKLKLQDGSEGTAGHVWTSTGTNGEGAWAAGGGNETLVFDAANNQNVPANVTGLILDPDVQHYYYLNVTYRFTTSGSGAVESEVIAQAAATYLAESDTWYLELLSSTVSVAAGGAVDSGFNISSLPNGQVQYTTGDVTNGGTTGTTVDEYKLTFLITDPGGVSGGGGGSTSPGGPDRAIQFAAMGTFDGEANFLWTSNQLQITNEITSPASAASYAVGIKNNGDYALTLGGDNTATYIQAWNNKPLWINQFGNNVGIGTGLAAIDEMLVVGGNIKTGNSVFAGDFRAANEAYFLSRNAADNAYISLIKADSSNQVVIGDASQVIRNLTTRFDVISSSQVNFYAGNAQVNILSNGAGAPAVRWHDDDSSNFIGLKAPSVVPSNIIYTWPAVDAVGSLTSDGAGNLSWAAGGGATVALDNLASVAINTPLLPGTQDTVNFGSDIKSWFAVFGNQFQLFNGGDQKAYWIWDGGSDSVFMVTEKNQTIHSSKRLTLEAGSATDQGFLFGGNGQLYFGDGSNLVPLTNGAIDVGISGNQIGTVHTLAVASDSNLSISSSNTILTAGLLTLFNSPTDPAGGVAGSMYFNTGINKAKVHNGTSWEVITSS